MREAKRERRKGSRKEVGLRLTSESEFEYWLIHDAALVVVVDWVAERSRYSSTGVRTVAREKEYRGHSGSFSCDRGSWEEVTYGIVVVKQVGGERDGQCEERARENSGEEEGSERKRRSAREAKDFLARPEHRIFPNGEPVPIADDHVKRRKVTTCTELNS